jgi:hypothetical protein
MNSNVPKLLLMPLSILVCAIPERYRLWWPIRNRSDLHVPAIASGAIEFLASAPGTIFYVAGALNAAKDGLGIAGLILNPSWIFAFLFIEGALRLLAAVSAEQVLPTLPLQIIAWVHDLIDARAAADELGPLLPDRIQRLECDDLRISSCRAKAHWNSYMTIRF